MKSKFDKADFEKRKALYESKRLHEDEVIAPVDEEILEKANYTGMIGDLIKQCWENIDRYNQVLVSLSESGREDILETLRNMCSDEYMHIGELEGHLKSVAPEAENLNLEVEEIPDVLAEVEPVEEELNEASKGFIKRYREGSIHETQDKFIAVDKNGKNVGESPTIAGAEAFLDELYPEEAEEEVLPADDVDESLAEQLFVLRKK